jgi:hypothetical protein
MKERIEQIYRKEHLEKFGYSFKSGLVSVNKGNSNYRHLDYYPLVNARAHSVG